MEWRKVEEQRSCRDGSQRCKTAAKLQVVFSELNFFVGTNSTRVETAGVRHLKVELQKLSLQMVYGC